ncbi:MAG: hypothetical protein AAGG38_06370 [Planctomycetota bacterium]
MSIEIIEQPGRSLSGETYERRYLVTGTMSDTDARKAVLSEAPATYGSLRRDDARVEELRGRVGHWLAEVTYISLNIAEPETGDQWFSMSTRVETTRVTRSRDTVGTFAPAGETSANYDRLIGVSPGGDVEGVDVQVPVYSFTVEKHQAPSVGADSNYIRDITQLLARVNDSPFSVRTAMDDTGSSIVFEPHEVLLIGASAGRRGNQPWEFRFEFAASPNLRDLDVDAIAGITKRGWDYLWLRYEQYADDEHKVMLRKPVAAYVEQVYQEGDFSRLRIAG